MDLGASFEEGGAVAVFFFGIFLLGGARAILLVLHELGDGEPYKIPSGCNQIYQDTNTRQLEGYVTLHYHSHQ